MPTDKELMQQALEALESEHPEIQLRAAIALRERLAQPEQEPFALLVRKHSWNEGQYECAPPNAPEYGRQWADERVLVYTAPPQRKPLTDEQADSIINGLRTCLHLDSKRMFLKTWLRDWAEHNIKEST